MNLLKNTVITLTFLTLTGCYSGNYMAEVITTEEPSLHDQSYEVVDELISYAEKNSDFSGVSLNSNSPFIIASFVDVNQMDQSSAFGRIISEQFASRFSQKGYYVVELKLRKDIFIKEKEGEFMLSRKIKEITRNHNAQAIIVGTYATGENNVYITTKMIDPPTNRIISSYDYRLPISEDVRKLLEVDY
ncbi:MAG: FlgO family outer membrane protein [Candidatus Thioglobus sp.]|nr:FlgO family outer membrane protein [Candidatus Thioglobus sp.]